MTNVIGTLMKKRLVDYIRSSPYPVGMIRVSNSELWQLIDIFEILGMIVDGSVSESNIKLFAILFQLIEKNAATCHFYGVSSTAVECDYTFQVFIGLLINEPILGLWVW